MQKLSIFVLFIYYTLSIIANWFAVANFFILFDCVIVESKILLLQQSSASSSSIDENPHNSSEPTVLTAVHTMLVLTYLFTASGQFAVALGTKPDQATIFYYSLTLFLGVSSYLLIMMLVFAFVKEGIVRHIQYSYTHTYMCYMYGANAFRFRIRSHAHLDSWIGVPWLLGGSRSSEFRALDDRVVRLPVHFSDASLPVNLFNLLVLQSA